MGIPVNALNKEQKAWYANLVVASILADDEISPSEIDFLKQVVSIIEDPTIKKELLGRISAKNKPEIAPPPEGIAKEMLAAIYMELCMIMISDLDFAESEKEFLKEIADILTLDRVYAREVIRWAEAGLNWKESRLALINSFSDGKAPQINELGPDQKKWYAKTLISTIMLDGQVDESELSFLKAAVCFVDNKKDQKELTGYVRNRIAPKLEPPVNIPKPTLIEIFIEIMRTVSADESLSYAEHAYLKQFSDLCDFDKDLFEKLITWCNEGISWARNKTPLISSCKLAQKKELGQGPEGFAQNSDNSSIINREFGCFVCESAQKTKAFKLKQYTQEASHNIFGITTYLDSMDGRDYIDYNRVKVIVCPNCFFASVNKDHFRKNEKEKAPDWVTPQFKKAWLKDLNRRKAAFKGLEEELASVNRTNNTVLRTYQMAIKSADAISGLSNDETIEWLSVTTTLTLAEIVMNLGSVEKGEELLIKAQKRAEKIFKSARNVINTFRAARLLFYIALYYNDVQTAGPYTDFLRDYRKNKLNDLKDVEQGMLIKILGEIKKSLQDRSELKKENLIGFHKYL